MMLLLIVAVAFSAPVFADDAADAMSLFHTFTPNRNSGASPAPQSNQHTQSTPFKAAAPAPASSQPPTNYPPPQAAPSGPAQINDADYDWDEFVPFNGVRHDEFDWALTKNLLSKGSNNTMISPFLVKLLLSILTEAAGRNTSTYRELATVLPSIQTLFQARDLYLKIFDSLLQKSPDYELDFGVKMYVDRFIEPRQRFQAIVQSFYHADVEQVDFSSVRATTDLINGWCSNTTRGHIKDIVTEEDVEKAVILLLNAIYFNGYWKRPFAANETVPLPFYTGPTTRSQIPFMTITNNFYYFESKELDSKILRLPYKGHKYAMYIVLPNQINGLNTMLRTIDSATLQRAKWLMDEFEVKVVLPRFKFENDVHLNEILQELGLTKLFTTQASLPALTRGAGVQDRLQVSHVLQKTGIHVNEKGSTVYAATQVSLVNKFGGETEFVADRPFLFLIEDEPTGTLLFSGTVCDPATFSY